MTERELKTNGGELAVTEENKADYVRRVVRWRLERGVRKQGQSLLRGFYEVIIIFFEKFEVIEMTAAGSRSGAGVGIRRSRARIGAVRHSRDRHL